MRAETSSVPVVEVERDALEADISSLNDAMLEILDVMFCEPNAYEGGLKALRSVHEAVYSRRRWNGEPSGKLAVSSRTEEG
jgi:hypothetical protein